MLRGAPSLVCVLGWFCVVQGLPVAAQTTQWSADDVVRRILKKDAIRRQELQHYTSRGVYVAENKRFAKRAEVRFAKRIPSLEGRSSRWSPSPVRTTSAGKSLTSSLQRRSSLAERTNATKREYTGKLPLSACRHRAGRRAALFRHRNNSAAGEEVSDTRHDLGGPGGVCDNPDGRRPSEESVLLDQEGADYPALP